jgi:hypothetical protein
MLFSRVHASALLFVVFIGEALGGCGSASTGTGMDVVNDSGIDGSRSDIDGTLPDSAFTPERDALSDRIEASTPADAATPESYAPEATSSRADAADSSDSSSGLDAKTPDASAICAMGPFVTNMVTVIDVSTSMPLAGATVKASVCGISDTTNANGKVALMIPVGVESYLRLDAAGKIPTLYPVRTLVSAQSEALIIFTDSYKAGYFPDYDASKAEIFVAIGFAGGSTTPCNAYDGVTISVIGHPEAVVTYWLGGSPIQNGVVTGAGGTATITGVAAGNQVILDLKKSGCKVAFAYPNSLPAPKLPLEAGAVTFFAPVVTN